MATIHTFNGNEIIATEVPKYLNDNFSALNSVDEDIKTQLDAKAPAYQYSTTDLTAGTDALTTGTLYLVYE